MDLMVDCSSSGRSIGARKRVELDTDNHGERPLTLAGLFRTAVSSSDGQSGERPGRLALYEWSLIERV